MVRLAKEFEFAHYSCLSLIRKDTQPCGQPDLAHKAAQVRIP
jgi:hypothetical protein